MDVTKAIFQIESSVCILNDKDIIIDKWTAIALEHFLTEEIVDLDQEKSFFFNSGKLCLIVSGEKLSRSKEKGILMGKISGN